MIRRVTLDNKIFIFFIKHNKNFWTSENFFANIFEKYENFIIQSDPSDHCLLYKKCRFVIKNTNLLIAPNLKLADSCTNVKDFTKFS